MNRQVKPPAAGVKELAKQLEETSQLQTQALADLTKKLDQAAEAAAEQSAGLSAKLEEQVGPENLMRGREVRQIEKINGSEKSHASSRRERRNSFFSSV